MAPKLSEDEIDDLIYLARAGEDAELDQVLKKISEREKVTVAQVLEAAKDDGKATCLHMAAANGHSTTVTHILAHLPITPSINADASSTDGTSDSTPAPAPTYINSANSYGNTALHWACLGAHLDVVKLLLSRGADPTAANDKDQIPLDLAAFNNHMEIVEFFLSQSRNLEGKNAEKGGLDGGVGEVEMVDAEEDGGEKTGESSGT